MKYAMITLIAAIFTFTTAATAQTRNTTVTNAFTGKAHSPLVISGNAEEFKNISPELIALNNSGVENALRGNYGEAINAFRQMVFKAPALPQARYNLATTLAYDKQYDEAIRIFRDVIASNPDYAPAHANLGETLYKIGSFAESIKSFRQALRLNPTDANTMVNLGSSLHKEKGYQEALRWFDTAKFGSMSIARR